MAWIESHQQLGRHPKTLRAAKRLGVSRVLVVGHLQYLWWWCLDYAPDGDLSGFDDDEIAQAAEWDGDADAFVGALVDAGFLDQDGDRLAIHDNGDYNGKLRDQREKNRERQQRYRDTKRDVTVTSQPRNGYVTPLPNQPNQTVKAAAVSNTPLPPIGVTPSVTPPPPQEQKREPTTATGRYEATLDVLIPAVVQRWRQIDDELTEPWLRSELRRIEADVGELSQPALIAGLKLAQQQIERARKNGGIKSTPRGFAAKVMRDAFDEQRDRHPGPSPPGRRLDPGDCGPQAGTVGDAG